MASESEESNLLIHSPSPARYTFVSTTKNIATIAAPIFIYQGVDIVGSFITTLLLSKLGKDELNAGNYIGQVQNFLLNPAFAILGAIGPVVARTLTTHGKHEAGSVLFISMGVALLLSVPGICLQYNTGAILKGLNQNPRYADIAQEFFTGAALSLPAIFILRISQDFLVGITKPNWALFFNALNNGLSLGIGYCLMNGIGLRHSMGITGLGYGFTIGAWAALLLFFMTLKLSAYLRQYDVLRFKRHTVSRTLNNIFKLGLPRGVSVGTDIFILTITLLMLTRRWKNDLTAYSAAAAWLGLLAVPTNSLDMASSVLVGRKIGAKAFAEAKYLGNTAIFWGVLISSTISMVCLLTPKPFVSLFLAEKDQQDSELMTMSTDLLRIFTVFLVSNAVRFISEGALSGCYDARYAMFNDLLFATILPFLVVISLAYGDADGHTTIRDPMIGKATCLTVAALLLGRRWLRKKPTDINKPDTDCFSKLPCGIFQQGRGAEYTLQTRGDNLSHTHI